MKFVERESPGKSHFECQNRRRSQDILRLLSVSICVHLWFHWAGR